MFLDSFLVGDLFLVIGLEAFEGDERRCVGVLHELVSLAIAALFHLSLLCHSSQVSCCLCSVHSIRLFALKLVKDVFQDFFKIRVQMFVLFICCELNVFNFLSEGNLFSNESDSTIKRLLSLFSFVNNDLAKQQAMHVVVESFLVGKSQFDVLATEAQFLGHLLFELPHGGSRTDVQHNRLLDLLL